VEAVRTLVLSIVLLLAGCEPPPPSLQPTPEQAAAIGQQIWQNEGAGKVKNLTVWNQAEAFPSFGIGHFIWFPQGVQQPFQESFPALRDYLARHHPLPEWLAQAPHAPWQSREQFYREIDSPEMNQLREILQQTIPLQVNVIVQRLQQALPKMLATLPREQQAHVERQFYRVAQQPNGLYVLIDYVNFKGEGSNPKERYQGKGWGLLQVLQTMLGESDDVLGEFRQAADLVLTRRVANAPRDESRWLAGWRKRLSSYRNHPESAGRADKR